MDIGLSRGNATTLIWFQVIGNDQIINIIDCYSSENLGLDFYAHILQERQQKYGYKMGIYLAPHDLRVREWGAGAVTRYEKARQLDITFTILDQHLLADQIENALTHFPKVWIDQTKCKSLVDALENYYREWDEQKQVYGKPVHNWACFVGETPILTRNGMRQIMDIQKDDEILTLFGWKKCNKSKIMKQNAHLVEVTFKDGTKVKCTPDHMFLTVNGWRSAVKLKKGSKILSSLTKSHNFSADTSIDSTLRKYILPKGEQLCTGMCGGQPLEKFLKDVMYTIKMEIHTTMHSGTWNRYHPPSTFGFLEDILKGLVKKLEKQPPNGMLLPRESCGISATLRDPNLGRNGEENLNYVSIAIGLLNVLLETMHFQTNKSFVMQTAEHLIIESVVPLKSVANVYCINVPDIHHFSLSNGAVVHNSNYASAFMGIFLGLHHCATRTTGEQYDKLRNEMLYGGQYANLPRIFRQGIQNIRDGN